MASVVRERTDLGQISELASTVRTRKWEQRDRATHMSNLAATVQDLPESPWLGAALSAMSLTHAEHVHSEANVCLWRSYLPADCVNKMIAQGWHLST
jgi:hypothetical protein